MSGENSRLGTSDPEADTSERLKKFRMLTSLDDMVSLRFWKAVWAEFVGTLILVLVGCGSFIQSWPSEKNIALKLNDTSVRAVHNYYTTDVVQIALAFGLSVATVIWLIGHISGGHVNPSVTCAMFITRRISLARALIFITVQLLGAIVGAGILRGVTPSDKQGTLGCTLLGQGVDGGMGVGVEVCITFVLVLTVFATYDKHRKDLAGSFPLTIGLSVTTCHLFAVKFTGSSMNTARSFGPAVVMGIWKDNWVYWLGPILGGMLAGLVYDNVFAANASRDKCRAFLFGTQYDDDKHPAQKYKIRVIEEEYEKSKGEEEMLASCADKDTKHGLNTETHQ